MASAGYNPIELANFFEKLEKQTGAAAQPKGLAAWFSSHPSPGNRVEYVSEDTTFYAKKEYTAATGISPRVKQLAAAIPPPKSHSRERCWRPKRTPRPAEPAGRVQGRADGRVRDRVPVGLASGAGAIGWERDSGAPGRGQEGAGRRSGTDPGRDGGLLQAAERKCGLAGDHQRAGVGNEEGRRRDAGRVADRGSRLAASRR